MQENHADIADIIENEIFSIVMDFEKAISSAYRSSGLFRKYEMFLQQQANLELLSIQGQEFVSYVMQSNPSRQPLFILESILREITKTGGDEGGSLDLFKNPLLVTKMEEKADQPETESVEDVPLD